MDKAEVNVVEQGRSPTAWHFAYGANMCSTVLSKRRGIRPLSAHAACVEGHDVVFNMPGLYPIEPAFANLVVQESSVVYGVLYELSAHDLERLRSFEGKYYVDVHFRVRTQAGWAIHAHAFQGRSKAPPRRPSRRYLALLIEGAKEHTCHRTMLKDCGKSLRSTSP